MLFKSVFVLIFSLLYVQTNSFRIDAQSLKAKILNVNPLDLLDDAQGLIDDLHELVLGNIFVAHDALEDIGYDLDSYSIDLQLNTEIDIQQEKESMDQQISNLKELALAEDADITSCLEGNEDRLNVLPDQILVMINECIDNNKEESETVLSVARYNVDVVINKVQSLSFALGQCSRRDEACINSVIDQVNEAITDLPLDIQATVDGADEDIEIVEAKIQTCANGGVADLVRQEYQILGEITDCVEAIIS